MAILTYLTKFLVYYALTTIAFYMLSLVIPKAAFVARALAAYICLLLAAGSGVFTSILMRLVGYGHSAQWAVGRCYAFLMALTTGIRFEIVDPHNVLNTTRPAVFVGNHQTELDVLMLGAMFPQHCSMTAKSSLKRTPFLGWFMTLSGCIFINRTKAQDAREAMRKASAEMRDKAQSVYLFPEGTRSYSREPELLPFKKGAFHLAVEGQVPIVPCVVANYSHVLWIKGLVFRSGTIPIKVMDPIPTKGLTTADVDELTRSTRELMLKELISLTEQARGKTPASRLPTTAEINGAVKASGVDMKVAA
ncbi:hypothetical protein QBC39DRAFT_257041 [Podospora conica]|nr:hypothetical protein QBC39DRAFT_257041 [Schizothecium conicum]